MNYFWSWYKYYLTWTRFRTASGPRTRAWSRSWPWFWWSASGAWPWARRGSRWWPRSYHTDQHKMYLFTKKEKNVCTKFCNTKLPFREPDLERLRDLEIERDFDRDPDLDERRDERDLERDPDFDRDEDADLDLERDFETDGDLLLELFCDSGEWEVSFSFVLSKINTILTEYIGKFCNTRCRKPTIIIWNIGNWRIVFIYFLFVCWNVFLSIFWANFRSSSIIRWIFHSICKPRLKRLLGKIGQWRVQQEQNSM